MTFEQPLTSNHTGQPGWPALQARLWNAVPAARLPRVERPSRPSSFSASVVRRIAAHQRWAELHEAAVNPARSAGEKAGGAKMHSSGEATSPNKFECEDAR